MLFRSSACCEAGWYCSSCSFSCCGLSCLSCCSGSVASLLGMEANLLLALLACCIQGGADNVGVGNSGGAPAPKLGTGPLRNANNSSTTPWCPCAALLSLALPRLAREPLCLRLRDLFLARSRLAALSLLRDRLLRRLCVRLTCRLPCRFLLRLRLRLGKLRGGLRFLLRLRLDRKSVV